MRPFRVLYKGGTAYIYQRRGFWLIFPCWIDLVSIDSPADIELRPRDSMMFDSEQEAEAWISANLIPGRDLADLTWKE